ncbi:hypothetical protein FAES_1844 [Fibrella aestuarina BUZ 2]|uniref:Uncharacterized protein n=1 Tax=Fibrella aestuarina BUZ 2 TaxID=1166018 RepID=I0K6V1_9BACT|nr:hypothetical protein [Fibrella aestuarina]CCG99854.1 hypothetical protein FAES_1844 [Fibrella aestuarina BUZ 2]
MTNPFASIVGLRGLNNEARSIYVNDLPGISTELVTALRKDDQTVADTWARINDLALSKLSAMLETEFNKSGEFKHTVASSSVFEFKPTDLREAVTMDSRLQGCRLTVPYAPYRQVRIDGLYANLTVAIAATVEVKAYNLMTGDYLDNQSVYQKTGPQNFTPFAEPMVFDVPLHGLDLFVGVESPNLTLSEIGGAANPLTGDSGATMTTGTLDGANRTASGFVATDCRFWFVSSVSHSLSAVIARYAFDLADAFRHLTGSCLMDDKRGSTRINLYTNTNLEFAAEKAEKLCDDAYKLLKPIARRILTDLANVPGPVVQADSEVQAGYYRGSMLG